MRLNTLRLQNFKGLRDFTLDLGGHDATIRATNGAGKTTLADAMSWLLTGKDMTGAADFDIKTLAPDGESLHNLEHSVEATLQIGDGTLTLKRAYVEVWTRKRGSRTDEFTGHETKFWIDGVPCGTKREYEDRVAELAPPAAFRLLTDPSAFMELHWQERRKILLDVCGDVTDADVIASDPSLADLPGILGKRSLDEHRKVVDARRREINRELQAIPVRIDEATNGRPSLPDEPREQLEANLATLRDARTALERQRARLEAGGAIAELQAKAREIDGKLADVARSVTAGAEEKLALARKDRARLEDDASRARRAHAQAEQDRDAASRRREALVDELDKLRARWNEINDRTPPHAAVASECPACGQALPAEQVTAAHQRALEEWNARQAQELEAVQTRGQALRRDLDTLTARLDKLHEAVAGEADDVARTRAAEEAATKAVDELTHAIPDPTTDPQHQLLVREKAKLEEQIASLRSGNTEQVATLRADIAKLDAEIATTVASIGAFDLAAKSDARIEALTASEKSLATEFEGLERQLHLLDAFTRAKAAMLTDRINSRFAITRWRLFDTQINGGLQDACTALVNGVPYGTGLNRAARINSGLDVIRVLQEHHHFWPPVFIDEAESVVETLPLDSQVVRLIVDDRHATLTVALDAPQEVAA